MRIKSDFVTNSSSTSYIVCIPETFTISDKKLRLIIEDHQITKEEDIKMMMTQINTDIQALKNGIPVRTYSYQFTDEEFFDLVNNRMYVLDTVIYSFIMFERETTITEETTIWAVPYNKFKEAFLRMHENHAVEMFKQIQERATQNG